MRPLKEGGEYAIAVGRNFEDGRAGWHVPKDSMARNTRTTHLTMLARDKARDEDDDDDTGTSIVIAAA
jgi:hypothetical protein